MALKATFQPHSLIFKFNAGTSRGVLKERKTYIVKLWNMDRPDKIAYGEAGPIAGLSLERPDLDQELEAVCDALDSLPAPESEAAIPVMVEELVSTSLPSIRFALEMALFDLLSGANLVPFPGNFSEGSVSIPINGLVWMGSFDFMKSQVDQKVAQGYNCIKIKIGAIDFVEECKLLEYIRNRYGEGITLRVDANGAFHRGNVFQKLNKLSNFGIHSIEQPVGPGQLKLSTDICRNSPVPIALDEELIKTIKTDQRKILLDSIKPQYIVLKPTLLGGIKSTSEWIQLAEERDIQWWITSALESNIGLNAIAQFTASFDNKLPQGLGTGQLFENNFPCRLYIEEGRLFYRP